MIDGFPLLALVLAPPFLLVGAAMVGRKTALPALAFLLGLSSAMALQETFSADFAAFINTNTAQYVALWVALVVTRSMRSMSIDASAHRLLRLTWSKLAMLAHRQRSIDLIDLAAQLVDRLGLVTPKLATAGGGEGGEAEDALADVRIAMNLAMLQQSRADLSASQSAAVERVLTQVGRHFAERAAGGASLPGDELLAVVNDGLGHIVSIKDAGKRSGVTALVGLRRNLFPNAPPFHAEALS
jgi:uncharacterized membrane protein YccC